WKSTGFLGGVLALLMLADGTLHSIPEFRAWVRPFLPPLPGAMLGLVVLANHVFYVRAAYLRAHVREPYVWVAVGQAVVLLASFLLAGRFGNIEIMTGAYLAWTVIFSLGWGGWIFRQKRREWHSA